MIVDTFKTEKELLDAYPKVEYFKLKNIFNDYLDDLIIFAEKKGWKIRPVVQRDVKRMMICNTSNLGTSVFKCPNCGNTKFVYNTCKSRFCNSCGIKYAKERALNIESKLISGNHRHLVFTISDS